MYIPSGIASSPPVPPALRRLGGSAEQDSFHILPVLPDLHAAFGELVRRSDDGPLPKRDTVQSLNTTIGVVVGVILGVFIIGLLAFCWWYRFSIRFTYRKKRHRKGSKASSKSSDGGAPPPPPPPA